MSYFHAKQGGSISQKQMMYSFHRITWMRIFVLKLSLRFNVKRYIFFVKTLLAEEIKSDGFRMTVRGKEIYGCNSVFSLSYRTSSHASERRTVPVRSIVVRIVPVHLQHSSTIAFFDLR